MCTNSSYSSSGDRDEPFGSVRFFVMATDIEGVMDNGVGVVLQCTPM
jgi:hypothetical protein